MLGLVYLFILYANRNIAFYILQLFLHEKFVFQMHVSSKPADLPSSCRLRVSICHLTTLRFVEVSRIDIQVTTGRFGLVRALMNLTLLLTVWLYLKAKHLTSRLSFKLLNIKANGGSSVCRFGTFHHDTINSASVQLSWVAQWGPKFSLAWSQRAMSGSLHRRQRCELQEPSCRCALQWAERYRPRELNT